MLKRLISCFQIPKKTFLSLFFVDKFFYFTLAKIEKFFRLFTSHSLLHLTSPSRMFKDSSCLFSIENANRNYAEIQLKGVKKNTRSIICVGEKEGSSTNALVFIQTPNFAKISGWMDCLKTHTWKIEQHYMALNIQNHTQLLREKTLFSCQWQGMSNECVSSPRLDLLSKKPFQQSRFL